MKNLALITIIILSGVLFAQDEQPDFKKGLLSPLQKAIAAESNAAAAWALTDAVLFLGKLGKEDEFAGDQRVRDSLAVLKKIRNGFEAVVENEELPLKRILPLCEDEFSSKADEDLRQLIYGETASNKSKLFSPLADKLLEATLRSKAANPKALLSELAESTLQVKSTMLHKKIVGLMKQQLLALEATEQELRKNVETCNTQYTKITDEIKAVKGEVAKTEAKNSELTVHVRELEAEKQRLTLQLTSNVATALDLNSQLKLARLALLEVTEKQLKAEEQLKAESKKAAELYEAKSTMALEYEKQLEARGKACAQHTSALKQEIQEGNQKIANLGKELEESRATARFWELVVGLGIFGLVAACLLVLCFRADRKRKANEAKATNGQAGLPQ